MLSVAKVPVRLLSAAWDRRQAAGGRRQESKSQEAKADSQALEPCFLPAVCRLIPTYSNGPHRQVQSHDVYWPARVKVQQFLTE
jgi:hypothetical protein